MFRYVVEVVFLLLVFLLLHALLIVLIDLFLQIEIDIDYGNMEQVALELYVFIYFGCISQTLA